MATSCTDFDHPYYEQLSGKTFREAYKFFTEEDAKRMKFVSLGEALDFISYGGGNFVGYRQPTKGLVNFIKTWIEKQEPRIDYEKIKTRENSYTYKEKGREYFYLWNKFKSTFPLPELPRINFESCPLDEKHKGTVLDRGGRSRCSHQSEFEIHPSFTKIHVEEGIGTGMKRFYFDEEEPVEPSGFEAGNDYEFVNIESQEHKDYVTKIDKFENEATVPVTHTCYAILSEPKDFYLSLETILQRLNCSQIETQTLHPFSGFDLAHYVHAWWEQPGEKRYWKTNNGIELYKEFKDFIPISTDD